MYDELNVLRHTPTKVTMFLADLAKVVSSHDRHAEPKQFLIGSLVVTNEH